MPVVFVYQASDFTTGLPDESGAAAAGSAPFVLTLAPGATPIAVEISDDDALFHEVDATQTLTSAVVLNGTSYNAGDDIKAAYHLSNSTTGHTITSFHAGPGVDGYGQGPVVGIVSTVPLTAGSSYSFDGEVTSHNNEIAYSSYVACFTEGTVIDTVNGPVLIQDLELDDLIETRDHGPQPVRWIGKRSVPAMANLAPIVFEPYAIGNRERLVVSPQHRVLISGWMCELLFSEDEVLVPASHLINGETIWRKAGGTVTYYHIMTDRHEIIYSNGTPSESFHPNGAAIYGMGLSAEAELIALFPELADVISDFGPAVRRSLKKHETRLLRPAFA